MKREKKEKRGEHRLRVITKRGFKYYGNKKEYRANLISLRNKLLSCQLIELIVPVSAC